MARRLLFTGLYVDDDMDDGWVRVMSGRRWSLTMSRRTFFGLEHNRRKPEMMLMLDYYGVGMHQLPDDLWS